jgi:hypothetical protein
MTKSDFVPEMSTLAQTDFEDEPLVAEVTNIARPPRTRRFTLVLVGVAVFALIAGVVHFHAPGQLSEMETQGTLAEFGVPQNAATPALDSMSVADFIGSKHLAGVAGYVFKTECPKYNPGCNVADVFNSNMKEQLEKLEKGPFGWLYTILDKHHITAEQQQILMKVLSMAHDKRFLRIGEIVAKTVKRWAPQGKKVVHQKVREALIQYSNEHGSYGLPQGFNSSKVDDQTLEIMMHSGVLRTIPDDTGSRRLLPPSAQWQITLGTGVPSLLSLVLLIFMILQKAKVVHMPLMFRIVLAWIDGVLGTITCIATVLLGCPFVFLLYWLDCWLLFGNNPAEVETVEAKIPWWEPVMKKLPGLNGQARKLLAMDSRIGA